MNIKPLCSSSQCRSLCDIINIHNVRNIVILLIYALLLVGPSTTTINLQYSNQVKAASQQQQHQQALNNEFHLVGQSNGETRLPCLIGRQLYCGEVYFIAWYKLNSTSGRQWTRIEYKTSSSGSSGGNSNEETDEEDNQQTSSLNDRVEFNWAPGKQNNGAACLTDTSPLTSQRLINQAAQFDCGQLIIKRLELSDEGQYKCEITFSESIDFEKCPSNTMTQLNVIARPNEPEILVNGRPVHQMLSAAAANGSSTQLQQLTFKENSQVKLECQSSGGRPAPRIEWLNLTTTSTTSELQLMRNHWPNLRRTSTVPTGMDSGTISGGGGGGQPITSNSLTITLSRFDLKSRFICLVLPQPLQPIQPAPQTSLLASSSIATNQYDLLLAPNLRQPKQLADLLDQIPMLANSRSSNELVGFQMLKWIKFDVLAKPSSVFIQIKDLDSNALVLPTLTAGPSATAAYPLEPNKLYAIQCLIDNSRPKSQVNWFNRTNLIQLEQARQLDSQDYLVQQNNTRRQHYFHHQQLASFTRYIEQPNGLFRTVASLLFRPSYWNNVEDIFCRIQNEAFKFDELNQVAPIVAARLHVNFAPSAWIDWQPEEGQLEGPPEGVRQSAGASLAAAAATLIRLKFQLDDQLHLRCHLAASPFGQEAIIQFDWFRDGKLIGPSTAAAQQRPANNNIKLNNVAALNQRVRVEKSNHLHMPAEMETNGVDLSAAGEPQPLQQQQRPQGRLLVSSSLIIDKLTKLDAGTYTCQYKLIPTKLAAARQAPIGTPMAAGQQTNSISGNSNNNNNRIVSGQASEMIRVAVVGEAKRRGPTIRVASSEGLFVYGSKQHQQQKDKNLIVVVAAADHQYNQAREQQQQQLMILKCEMNRNDDGHLNWKPAPMEEIQPANIKQQIFWYLNDKFLSSSSTSSSLNLTLKELISAQTNNEANYKNNNNNFRLTCAHHAIESSSPNEFHSAQSMKAYQSLNEVNLKLKVWPNLIDGNAAINNNNNNNLEMMPQVRSLSEQELVSHPNGRLKLTCVAQCEPICSLDWYLNNQRLLDSGVNPQQQHQQLQRRQVLQMNSTKAIMFVSSTTDHRLDWMAVENLIKQNDTGAGWLRQTKTTRRDAVKLDDDDDHLKAASSQLDREMQSVQEQIRQANVLGQLELTYQDIQRMRDQELTVECRLNGQFNREAQFAYKQVAPFEWFPAASRAEGNDDDDDDHDGQQEDDLQGFVQEPIKFESILSPVGQQTKWPIRSMKTVIRVERPPKVDLASPQINLIEQAPALNFFEQQLNKSAAVLLLGTNNSSSFLETTNQQQQQHHSFAPLVRNWLASRLDVILIMSCSIALIYLLTIFVSAFIRRHYSSCYSSNKSHLTSSLSSNSTTNNEMMTTTSTANTLGRMQLQLQQQQLQQHRLLYGQHPASVGSMKRRNDGLMLTRQLPATTGEPDDWIPSIPLINGANNTTSRINLDHPASVNSFNCNNPYGNREDSIYSNYNGNFNHINNYGRACQTKARLYNNGQDDEQLQQQQRLTLAAMRQSQSRASMGHQPTTIANNSHQQEHIYDDVIYNQMIL